MKRIDNISSLPNFAEASRQTLTVPAAQQSPLSQATTPVRFRQNSRQFIFGEDLNRSTHSTPGNSAPGTPARVGGHERIRTVELQTALNAVLQKPGKVGDKGWPKTANLCERYFKSGYENIWQRNEGGYVSVPSNYQDRQSEHLRYRDVHWTPENKENGILRPAHFTAAGALTRTDPSDGKQRQIEVMQNGRRYFIMARIHQDDRPHSIQTLDRLFAVNSEGTAFNVSVENKQPKKNDPKLKREGEPLPMSELESVIERLTFRVVDVPMKNQPFYSPKTLSLNSRQLSTGTTQTLAKQFFEEQQPERQRLIENQYTSELMHLLDSGILKIDAIYRDENAFPITRGELNCDLSKVSKQRRDSILQAIFVAAKSANNADTLRDALTIFNKKIKDKMSEKAIFKLAFDTLKSTDKKFPFDGLTVHSPGISKQFIAGTKPLHILFDNQLQRFRGLTYTKSSSIDGLGIVSSDVADHLKNQSNQPSQGNKERANLRLEMSEFQALRESLPTPLANQGGGDCLFHALEGRNLADEEMNQLRRVVADVRLNMPENPGSNLAQAAQAYNDSGRQVELAALQGLDGLSNAQYADIQATRGIFAGDEEILQWIVQRNQRTGTATAVWLIDHNERQVSVYNAAGRRIQNDSVSNLQNQLSTALDSGAVVISQAGAHFERILRQ